MTPPDLAEIADPWYWFTGFTGPATPYTYLLLGFFALATLLSAVVWLGRRRFFRGHRVKVRMAHRLGPWFFGVSLTGLGLVLLRIVESPILTARVLWLICLVALVGLAVHLVRYMRQRYPLEVAAFEREERQRPFMPKAKARRKRR